MKGNFKKSLFLFSIFFVMLISITMVSAEDVDLLDSDVDLAVSNVDLAESNEDLNSVDDVVNSQDMSSNEDSLSSENALNLEENDVENTVENTDLSLSEESLNSVSQEDSDEISNINAASKNKHKSLLSSSEDNYYDAYVNSVKARFGSTKYVYFGWKGYFRGYFEIYDSYWDCVHRQYISGTNGDYQFNLDDLDVDTYTAALVPYDDEEVMVAYGTIKITKSYSKISVKTVKTKKGVFYIYAYVKDRYEGFNYNGGKVKFRINGKNYYAALKNGVAKLKFKVPKKSKKYTCKVIDSGGSNVYSNSKKFKFTVRKHKYYVYKAKKKYKVFKLGHNINGVELDNFARHGWKLVRYWTSSERHYNWMLGYWYMVYGKFKKTYWVKKAKYRYY